MGHQLHQRRVDENARRDRVEHAVDDERRVPLWGVRVAHSEPNGDRDRGGQPVRDAQEVRGQSLGPWPWDGGQTGAQTQTLEGLVEDEHDVQRDKFLTGDRQGQTDEDGMEDDAKFEDEDRRQLRHVLLQRGVLSRHLGVLVLARMTQMVLARDVALGLGLRGVNFGVLVEVAHAVVVVGRVRGRIVSVVVAVVALTEACVAHDHQLDEEEHNHGHQDDALDPGVLGDGTRETLIGQSLLCRG